MAEDDQHRRTGPGRRGATLLIAGILVVGALALACTLLAGALRLGLVRPPAFSVPVGDTWLVAPCPDELNCPDELPYYAVWQGERQPDGSTSYELRYFTYLPRRRP